MEFLCLFNSYVFGLEQDIIIIFWEGIKNYEYSVRSNSNTTVVALSSDSYCTGKLVV